MTLYRKRGSLETAARDFHLLNELQDLKGTSGTDMVRRGFFKGTKVFPLGSVDNKGATIQWLYRMSFKCSKTGPILFISF